MSIDYTNYDYEALVERMTELLKNKPGWGEGYESSTGQTLIELMGDVNDHLMYMLERRSQEAFIDTARLRTSVMAHASELGYRPRRKVSATGRVRLTLLDENEDPISALGDISIPKNTIIKGVGHEFIVAEDTVIEQGESSKEFVIKQGIPVSQIYNFSTEPYKSDPTIVIDEYNKIEEYSIVINDADGYIEDIASPNATNKNLTSLSYAMPNDAFYDIKFAFEGMRLVFGNGEFGKLPKGNTQIMWVESKGSEVDVVSTGNEFLFDFEFLEDDRQVSPQQLYKFSIENISPIRGGLDEETVKDISRNAPIFTRTANRAVTNSDFEFLALRSGIGNIADISSFGEHELSSLVYKMNNVYLSYITRDTLPLNVEQKKQLLAYLTNFKMVTTHIVLQEANRIDAVLDVKFKRHPNLPITDAHLYQVLTDYIEDFFELKRGSIGKQIQHSEFVRYLQNREFRFNDVLYDLTDFVKVDITAQYEIVPLETVYDVIMTIDPSYPLTQNDVWRIVLDGDNYSVSVDADETIATLVEKMRQEIFETTSFLTAVEDGDKLRIKSPFIDSRFTIDISFGDLADYVTSDVIYEIPASKDALFTDADAILAGSATVVDENEQVLFNDNGNGIMIPVDPNDVSFGINYRESYLLSPPFDPSVKYYLRYKQNEYQNIQTDNSSVVVLSPFADLFAQTPLYSKVEFI